MDKVLSDNFGGLTEEDSESEIVIILSKIRGIVLLHKTPKIHTYKVLDGRETLLTYIINICCKSSQYVKSYSFRVKFILFF